MKRTTPSPAGPSHSSGGAAESANPGRPQETLENPGAIEVPPILLEGDDPAPKPMDPGPVSRFSTPVPAEPPAAPGAESPLPAAYGTGRLSLTARDPHCLYAHWDRPPQPEWPEDKLTVRVHQESLAGPVAAERAVPSGAQHLFLPVEPRAGGYVADLGFYPAPGAWRSLTVSDRALSLGEPSGSAEAERFATLPFPVAKASSQGLSPAAAASEPRPAEVALASAVLPPEQPELVMPLATVPAGEFPLVRTSRPLNQASASEPLGPSLERELKLEELPTATPPEAGIAVAPGPGGVWGPSQQRALANLIAWNLVKYRGLSSLDLETITQAESTAPAELTAVLAGSARAAETSSEGLAVSPAEQPARFWLNVNAELVIYGATEPGSEVVIGGRPIQLRPDGSFSYRFSLPDGSYQLPIAAFSTTGEQRGVALEFSRKTSVVGNVGVHPQDPGLVPPH